MIKCELHNELTEAKEIISVFREENVRLENELTEMRDRIYDACDLCDILFQIDNRSVKILAGMIKKCLQEKRNVPVGRAEQGTNL